MALDHTRDFVFMALDHASDFIGSSAMTPRDITQPMLFLTRWITHFCAPVFIMLTGVSAYLYGTSKGRSKKDLSRFLFTRSLWIILVGFTLVRFGWYFSLGLDNLMFGTFWAIGTSMFVMAGLVYLPHKAILAVALILIFGHNLLDGIMAEDLGSFGWIWHILHQPKIDGVYVSLPINANISVLVGYPILPWPGVLALGYALVGPLFKLAEGYRRRFLLITGIAVTVGFVLLRATNIYGDPDVWSGQDNLFITVLSFLNCEKYPPSLLYLMMTLGPALILLSVLEYAKGRLADIVTNFGRVPFLFYVAHLPFIHALALIYIKLTGHEGVALPGVYVMWLFALAALYPLCRWFAGLKRRRHDWWLSYL